MTVATDWRGNTYDVGSTVLYPRMSGRSCEMQEGIVLEIKKFTDTRYRHEQNPDDGKWYYNSEEFENYKVKIKPTRSSRDFWRDGSEDYKPVWIHIGENVTAV